jgi:hypothetical protein
MRNHDDMDQLFKRLLPSATPEQIEGARSRLIDRVRAVVAGDRQLIEGGAVTRSRGWLVPAFAGVVILLVVAIGAVVFKGLERSRENTAGVEWIRTEANPRTITLSDNSRLEVGPNAELSLQKNPDGVGIQLTRGSVVVVAARQPDGHRLFVQTAFCKVTVVGTVFIVTAEPEGSRISVIDGVVRTHMTGASKTLKAGEQWSTSSSVRPVSIAKELEWNPNAATYIAMLHSAESSVLSRQQGLAPIQTDPIVTAPIEVRPIVAPPIESGSQRDALSSDDERLMELLLGRRASSSSNSSSTGRNVPEQVNESPSQAFKRRNPRIAQQPGWILYEKGCTSCHDFELSQYWGRPFVEPSHANHDEIQTVVLRENARNGALSEAETRILVDWLFNLRFK